MKPRFWLNTLVLALTVTVLANDAFAAKSKSSTRYKRKRRPTSSAAVSSASSTSLISKLREKVSISYYGYLDGPSVTDPSHQSMNGGKLGNPIYLYNSISARYKLTDLMSVYASPRFQWNMGAGHSLDMLNTRVGVSHNRLYKNGIYNLSGSIYYEVPHASDSVANSSLGNITISQTQALDIPGSRWTLGLDSYVRLMGYYEKTASNATSNNLGFFVGPFINYKILNNLSAMAYYETYLSHPRSEPSYYGYTMTTDTNLRVGMSWSPVAAWNISPQVKTFPGQQFDLAHTTFVMELTGKMF